jgi:hypothetical protein
MDNVIVIRLVNGEEVVADASRSEIAGVVLKNPAALVVHAGRDGRPSVGLADYLMFSEKKEITISDENILFSYEPNTDIKNSYSTSFGSGIVLAKSLSGSGNILPFTK